jgi:hypothetical protein
MHRKTPPMQAPIPGAIRMSGAYNTMRLNRIQAIHPPNP